MTKGLRASPVPLYLQIEEDIRSRIQAGVLRPLDQVLSESELAEAFGVSRMTARKSVDRLVSEGLLFRRAGKGTFVAPEKISHSASTQISFSGAMQALGLHHSTRVLEVGLAPAPKSIASALRQPEGTRLPFLRRLRYVEGEPAALHLAFLPPSLASILDEDLEGSLNELMTNAGARVCAARDTIETVPATTEDAKLLGLRRGAPLFHIEGVGLSASLEPLRYTQALYRGDRFRFAATTASDARGLLVQIKRDGSAPP
jgi:GntR family transcriptional regulator